jgi:transposase
MLPSDVAIYVATTPVDLRAGFDRLSGLVGERWGADARDGALYIFRNQRGTMLKVLFADRTGLCVLFKRLDRGKFPLPTLIAPGATRVEISASELQILLEGIVLPRRGGQHPPEGSRARKKTPIVH